VTTKVSEKIKPATQIPHCRIDSMATVQHRIGPADRGRRMELEDFLEADQEEGHLYELAGGVVEVIDIPKTPHRRITSNLYGLIRDYQRDHPGVVDYFGGGAEFRIWKDGMGSVRHPDLGLVFVGAAADPPMGEAPALLAEVISASSRDRDYREKRRDYWTFGAPEYWIVDPYQRGVTVLTRQVGEADWIERFFRDDDRIASALLPALTGRVADLCLGVPWDEL